jgi:hypothetical protein
MSKVTENLDYDDQDDMYDTEIADDDYGFIFDSNGDIKSVFLPDHIPSQLPEKIQKLLELFGINDIDNIDGSQTLH